MSFTLFTLYTTSYIIPHTHYKLVTENTLKNCWLLNTLTLTNPFTDFCLLTKYELFQKDFCQLSQKRPYFRVFLFVTNTNITVSASTPFILNWNYKQLPPKGHASYPEAWSFLQQTQRQTTPSLDVCLGAESQDSLVAEVKEAQGELRIKTYITYFRHRSQINWNANGIPPKH